VVERLASDRKSTAAITELRMVRAKTRITCDLVKAAKFSSH
jgi:hypothetical protein